LGGKVYGPGGAAELLDMKTLDADIAHQGAGVEASVS